MRKREGRDSAGPKERDPVSPRTDEGSQGVPDAGAREHETRNAQHGEAAITSIAGALSTPAGFTARRDTVGDAAEVPAIGVTPVVGASAMGAADTDVVPRAPLPIPARFDEVTDEDLMDYCVQGAERAFVELTRRYKTRIINLVYRFIRDHQRAEDLSQEVFVRVYLHRERYRKSGKFSTWIFTIAVNLAKNEIRRKVRLRNVLSIEGLQEVAGNAGFFLHDKKAKPDRDIERGQLNEIVQRSIEKLPSRYRMALVLRDIEGLPYEEIGEILQIPGGTVRSRINRARLMLKEKLKPYVRSGL